MKTSIRTCALAFAALVAAGAAQAHQAASGWDYDNWCCGGLDCQAIDSDNVSVTEDGFLVSIPETEHLTARRAHRKLFGYSEVRESGDGAYHACILPHSQEFRCLYVPQFTY